MGKQQHGLEGTYPWVFKDQVDLRASAKGLLPDLSHDQRTFVDPVQKEAQVGGLDDDLAKFLVADGIGLVLEVPSMRAVIESRSSWRESGSPSSAASSRKRR
jgi:hypothetical protein